MSPSLASERATVQNPLVAYAVEIGWQHLPREMAITLRQGTGGTLLYFVVRDKLIALNPGVVTAEAADQIIGRLESVRTSIEGNAEILSWLRCERSVFVQAEKRQRNVTVIDFDNP